MTARGLGRTVSALLAVAVLAGGFPGGVRIRAAAFAVALLSLAGGLAAPARALGVAVFAVVVSGSIGGTRALLPWPALIALWFGTGEAIRDAIRQRPAPRAPLDRAVDRLGIFWCAAAAVGALSARSLWAIGHGVALRAVNVTGALDAEALRGTLFAVAAVVAGATIYRAARRADAAGRRRARIGLVSAAALSSVVALVQSRGWIAAPRADSWVALGRFQGLAADPNAAGMVAALALASALAAVLHGRRRFPGLLASLLLAGGIAVSGSRSGMLTAAAAVVVTIVVELSGRERRPRAVLGLLVVAVTAVLIVASSGRGGAAARIASLFDRGAPLAYRTSSRGLFWSAAWDAFRSAPLGGIGWNAFSWNLPTLAAARGEHFAVMDNPGNFYVQILCETGLAGALLFSACAFWAARAIRPALRVAGPERGSAAALLGLAPALAVGSHLVAAEVSVAAFLLLADAAAAGAAHRDERAGGGIGALALAALAAAGGWAILLAPSRSADRAFRFSPEMGFYAIENAPRAPAGGGRFRWMRPSAAIRVPAGGRLRLAAVFPGDGANRLRIASEGRLCWAGDVSRRPTTLALEAPTGRPAVFELRSAIAFRPSDAGSDDTRLLSLQVFAASP